MNKRLIRILLLTLVLLALTTTVATNVAWAAGDGAPPGQEEGAAQDALWATLAPIVAIATAVERILEMFWERWEKAGDWPNKKGVKSTKSSDYIIKKKAGSHWLGTLIAVLAIGLTNVRFFRLLGFDVLFSSPDLMLFDAAIGGIFDDFTVGTLIDWVMTAGIIGWGGTELTHSIIEGLVKGRNLWKEMKEVEEGRKSILDAKFFNDYIAPELEKRGVSVAQLRQAFETLDAVDVSADELIGSMTIGKVDELIDKLAAKSKTAEAAQAVRTLLEGVPPEKAVDIPNVLNLLTPDQRQRFLGT
jgi:hypothetical protein